jgi:hypothetical protein
LYIKEAISLINSIIFSNIIILRRMKVLALLITFAGLVASAPLAAPVADLLAGLPPPANGIGALAGAGGAKK